MTNFWAPTIISLINVFALIFYFYKSNISIDFSYWVRLSFGISILAFIMTLISNGVIQSNVCPSATTVQMSITSAMGALYTLLILLIFTCIVSWCPSWRLPFASATMYFFGNKKSNLDTSLEPIKTRNALLNTTKNACCAPPTYGLLALERNDPSFMAISYTIWAGLLTFISATYGNSYATSQCDYL
jgi:hypothetical protein